MAKTKQTHDFIELPRAREDRLRRTLMQHFSVTDKYREGVAELRQQRDKIRSDGSDDVEALHREVENWEENAKRFVAVNLGLQKDVPVREKQRDTDGNEIAVPVDWAYDYVKREIKGPLTRPMTRPIGAVYGDDGLLKNMRVEGRVPKISRYQDGVDPGFLLHVSMGDLGIVEFYGDLQSDDDSEMPSWFECLDPNPHAIFDDGVSGKSWDALEAQAIEHLRSGIEFMRNQFAAQNPEARKRRKKGIASESQTLLRLRDHLLDSFAELMFAPKGATSRAEVQRVASELKIAWPDDKRRMRTKRK